ncbi:hypothetical protein [Pleomorphomonas carboxyditropha]|uniref:Vitamin K epoxide reductase domain-containing protein n=1 Tax=Pleomorphomonas carboxyditropha TaxID=2023338 RepID=A0A2G9WT83_9HYPH|nr:hypothetical protein [Pleomorphomonas carboxyditropha]PIO97919.1 hypothetical protein CJ014_17485 [Pleomorphomonas carboxyditropha]
MSSRLPITLIGAGAAAGLVTGLWWWVVYGRQVDSGSLPLANALSCLTRKTDICSLAEALCAQSHVLGITHYAPAAFWLSAALLAAGLVLLGRRSLPPESLP